MAGNGRSKYNALRPNKISKVQFNYLCEFVQCLIQLSKYTGTSKTTDRAKHI